MIGRRAHTLKGLRINEVSLVDVGANPGAVVLLAKRDQQEQPMEPTWIDVAKHYTAGLAANFPTVTRADFYGCLRALAKEQRQQGESIQQAIQRFKQTPDGVLLMKAYGMAPGPDWHPADPAPVFKRTGAAAEIDAKAHALLLNEGGNTSLDHTIRASKLAAARNRVRVAHPDLAARERAEERAAAAA
jgi:hypothetical protein